MTFVNVCMYVCVERLIDVFYDLVFDTKLSYGFACTTYCTLIHVFIYIK